jgi:hypothetical protein
MDRGTLNIGWKMKLLVEAIVLLVIGAIVLSVAIIVGGREPPVQEHGELRCEGTGAVVITINGKDFGVNGIAVARYPTIQLIWNKAAIPEANFERLIARGLTLCDW